VANAGGVISSYVEFIGGSEKEIFALVKDRIITNTELVFGRAKNGNLRASALEIAKERVKEAMAKRK
jgi:glutamate dehydrogenase/leucine dehydrogenase